MRLSRPPDEAALATTGPTGAADVPGRALRVLVVDDDARTRIAVADFLGQGPSLEVVGTVGSLDKAREAVEALSPDVVVLDLELGGEPGLDLVPLIREHRGTAIVLTSSDDPFHRWQALAAGARAFVSKFSAADDILKAVLAASGHSHGMGGLSHASGMIRPENGVESSASVPMTAAYIALKG